MILTVTANASIDKRYVVDDFHAGAVNRVKSCVCTAGGKGLNVSRAVRIAGEEVTATGFLGGHAGSFIEEQLQAEGVKSEFVWCSGESRSCINIWDEKQNTQTEFLEPGFSIRGQDADRLTERFAHLVGESSLVTISGSIPSGGGAELYQRLIACAKQYGKRVLLDTSGILLKDCLTWKPFLVKPNLDEIQMLAERVLVGREELLRAAEELRQQGASVVVISRGGEGSLIASAEGAFEARVPTLQTMNSVGCGDVMLAGFAVGITKGLPMQECIRLASAMSAASAMRMETGAFLQKDMEALLPRIEVTQIA